MLWKIFRRLAGVPQLLIAIAALRTDVLMSLHDEKALAAWHQFTGDPAVAAVLPRLSAEWRAVEAAVELLRG